MDLGIRGRRAAVAAASQGLGFATAKALVEEGVAVAIGARDAKRLEAAARRLGPLATPLPCDLSTPDGARDFVARAEQALGAGIDILVANTGGPPPGLASAVDPDTLRAALEGVLLSMVALCDAALPGMRERRWGRILAITSIGVRQPLPAMVYSNTARAGLTGYLKTLSREVIGDGVTVNSILPAAHRTERLAGLVGDERFEAYVASLPSGRAGVPDDFGRVAAMLCSAHAGYVTGVALPVDGGADAALL